MRVQLDKDLIVARGTTLPGVPVPAALADMPLEELRYDGSAVIDPRDRDAFAIDETGRKRLPEFRWSGWPVLDCAWDDTILRDGDTWRVQTEADRIEAGRTDARRRLIAWAEATLAEYTAGYPDEEIAAWSTKSLAAEAYLAGSATGKQAAMVEREAAAAGRDPAELAGRIVELADSYTDIISVMSGIRQAAEVAFAAGTTRAEWDAAIADAQAAFTTLTTQEAPDA